MVVILPTTVNTNSTSLTVGVRKTEKMAMIATAVMNSLFLASWPFLLVQADKAR